MKKIISFVITCSLLLTAAKLSAQTLYETSVDPKHPDVKILKGIINRSLIENDTSFNWYNPSQSIYYPDSAVITTFKNARDSIRFIIFGGTWCEDTQFILPKFFKLQQECGIADSAITLFGVDRDKKTLGTIAETFDITNVPTIIVMKDGKEIGRVIEYETTGYWDKELAAIISKN